MWRHIYLIGIVLRNVHCLYFFIFFAIIKNAEHLCLLKFYIEKFKICASICSFLIYTCDFIHWKKFFLFKNLISLHIFALTRFIRFFVLLLLFLSPFLFPSPFSPSSSSSFSSFLLPSPFQPSWNLFWYIVCGECLNRSISNLANFPNSVGWIIYFFSIFFFK